MWKPFSTQINAKDTALHCQHVRDLFCMSVSCSFLHIPGEELASDKVNQLGLCAEHSNDGCCKAHSPSADVNQPCHPTLITAEEYLK